MNENEIGTLIVKTAVHVHIKGDCYNIINLRNFTTEGTEYNTEDKEEERKIKPARPLSPSKLSAGQQNSVQNSVKLCGFLFLSL